MAQRFWVGGTGNWSSTAHWSTSSGGSTGASVPTISDDVIFDVNSFSGSGQTVSIDVAAVALSITYSGITQTNNVIQVNSTKSLSVVGTISITGHSIADRLRLCCPARGTSVSVSAGLWVNSNVDFEDIACSGPGMTNTDITGDLGGNSGTFIGRTPRTLYWFKDTGNYSNTALWGNSSGIANANTIPLPQDTARFDANSFSAGGKTVTMDVTRRAGCNWTGHTNSPTFNLSVAQQIYSTETLTQALSLSGAGSLTLMGRNMQFVTAERGNTAWIIDCANGTCDLIGSYRVSSSNVLNITSGTFNSNNNFITAGGITCGPILPIMATINLGRSIIVINLNGGNGNPLNLAGGSNSPATGLTVNASQATWILTGVTSGNYIFRISAINLGRLIVGSTGGGSITFAVNTSGTLTLAVDTLAPPFALKFNNAATIAITDWRARGLPGKLITLQSTINGTPYLMTNPNKIVLVGDYLSIQDSHADVAGLWYAGANSTNVSGNTNWIFTGHRRGSIGRTVIAQGGRTTVAQGTRTSVAQGGRTVVPV